MEPKAYLRLLAKEWMLVVELFEANKHGPIDYASLLQLVGSHKSKDADTHQLIEKFTEYDILGLPLSGETLYQLGSLTEIAVSHLMQEQRLGLSESIQAHISKLDELSQSLLNAVSEYEKFGIVDGCKRIYQHTQDIKHQVNNNLQAIRNIVSEAKNQETSKPLRQRYADVISAWDQYIKPMGEMIEINGAFDSIIDRSIKRIEQSTKLLKNNCSALISEIENVQRVRQMLNDMRFNNLINFQKAREILNPLYETARLNSKITRGASILLERVQKSRFNEIEEVALITLYRKPRMSLVSKNSSLMKYYYDYKKVKNRPPPTIPSIKSIEKHRNMQVPPLDLRLIHKKLKVSLPIDDVMKWAIDTFPDIETGDVLDITQLTYSDKAIKIKSQEECTYKTNIHTITGCRIEAEKVK